MNWKKAFVIAVPVVALALGVPGAVLAGNLVTNGDFSQTTGGSDGKIGSDVTVTGWSNNSGYDFLYTSGANATTGAGGVALWGTANGGTADLTNAPSGGNFIAADGDFETHAFTQTINGLTSGDTYSLTFNWAASQQTGFNGATLQHWAVSLGAQTQDTSTYSLSSHGFSGWMGDTMTFTADSSSELLSFLAVGNLPVPPFLLLDGVSLIDTTQAPPPVGTPEPATLSLVIMGSLVALGAVRMRRRAKTSAAV